MAKFGTPRGWDVINSRIFSYLRRKRRVENRAASFHKKPECEDEKQRCALFSKESSFQVETNDLDILSAIENFVGK